MNILLVNTFYFPNIQGGAEVSIKLLAEGLKSEGHNVAIFCIDGKNKGIVKENIEGIEIYRSDSGKFEFYDEKDTRKTYKKIINRLIGINNRYVGKNLKKVLEEFRPDIVHINNIIGISSIIWKVIKKKNIKMVQTARDYWIVYPVEKEKSKDLLRKMQIFLHHKVYKRRSYLVDCITAPSKIALDRILETGYFKNCKKEYVYNPIDINFDNTKKIIEKKMKNNSKNIKFIYVGRYSKEKGIENLLNAFHKVKNKNITLEFCGQGTENEIINKFIEDDSRIKNCGMLNKENLEKEYIDSDVIIVPSIWEEPFGRVVIEANQYGLPVIGSNRGGIKETLDLIHTGETFQYDDINDLKSKIDFFSNRENIKKYYKSILDNINQYSIENHIKRYLKIYSTL